MSFGDVLWAMIVFFFLAIAIWVFLTLFGDISHRRDLSGGTKAGWCLLILVIPFIGALIYLATRPSLPGPAATADPAEVSGAHR